MPLKCSRSFRVRYSECDAYGHLNNAHYARYMQETAFDASAAAGYSSERYAIMNRLWVVRTNEITHLLPLRYNQRVTVTTWVADFRRASSRRIYQFHLADTEEKVVQAYSDWVYVDTDTFQQRQYQQKWLRLTSQKVYPRHFQSAPHGSRRQLLLRACFAIDEA